MELAFLSGANPRVSNDSPIGRLAAGKWRIETRNRVDSTLWVNVGYGPPALHSLAEFVEIELDTPGPVQVTWQTRGSEKHLSVIAIKQD